MYLHETYMRTYMRTYIGTYVPRALQYNPKPINLVDGYIVERYPFIVCHSANTCLPVHQAHPADLSGSGISPEALKVITTLLTYRTYLGK